MRRVSSRARVASLVVLTTAMGSLSACTALLDDFVYVDAVAPPGDEVPPGRDASLDATPTDASPDGATDAAPPVDSGDDDDDGGVSPLTYKQVILDAKPLAYWRLDEAVGPAAHNATPGGTFNAAYFANVQLGVPGALVSDDDTAVHLSGATGAVVLAGGFAFFGARPFSVELWMRPTLPPSAAFSFLIKATAPAASMQMVYQEVGGSALHGVEMLAGVATYDNSTTDPVAAAWSYVVLDSDGTNLALFLNGRQVDLEPLANLGADAGDAGDAGSTFSIGGDENGFSSFTGDLDEVAVYARQLGATEIFHHYAVGSGHDAGM